MLKSIPLPLYFRRAAFFTVALLLSACVTVNINFPPAAAEDAADQIIEQVWQPKQGKRAPPKAEEEPADSKDGSAEKPSSSSLGGFMLNLLVRSAHADAVINISTPAIKALQDSMAARHQNLAAHYDNGAVGLTHDALITVRDLNGIGLRDRSRVKQWVDEENQDRLSLYAEIAKANNNPAWEDEIRETFARRWIEKAQPGWWYQDADGNWQQKK